MKLHFKSTAHLACILVDLWSLVSRVIWMHHTHSNIQQRICLPPAPNGTCDTHTNLSSSAVPPPSLHLPDELAQSPFFSLSVTFSRKSDRNWDIGNAQESPGVNFDRVNSRQHHLHLTSPLNIRNSRDPWDTGYLDWTIPIFHRRWTGQ